MYLYTCIHTCMHCLASFYLLKAHFLPSFLEIDLNADSRDLYITWVPNSQWSETKGCVCLPDNEGDSSVHNPVKIG